MWILKMFFAKLKGTVQVDCKMMKLNVKVHSDQKEDKRVKV